MLEGHIAEAGWTRVAFGDVVRKVNDKVDPWESGLERYVAGEHMDTDDLRIRRWGLIGDDYLGPAFHMRFKPGHVLYGSRRTYLRKVALADFEGITANTTFVLDTKDPARLMPELLPFLMQTEAFHSYSIKHSKGSVNPYINFSDLEAFEFLLPPIQEQARLVEGLAASMSGIEALHSFRQAASDLYNALSLDAFARTRSSRIKPSEWLKEGWHVRALEDLVSSNAPICYGIVQIGEYTAGGTPTLAIHNLSGDFKSGVHLASDAVEGPYRRSRVIGGDVVISIKGTIGEIATIPTFFVGNISRDLARLRFDIDVVYPDFFKHLYLCPIYQRYVGSQIVGSTRAELSIATLKLMEAPLPDVHVQMLLVERLDGVLSAKNRISRSIEQKRSMFKKVVKAALQSEADA